MNEKNFDWKKEYEDAAAEAASLTLRIQSIGNGLMKGAGYKSRMAAWVFQRELALAHMVRCNKELELLKRFASKDGDWRTAELPLAALPEAGSFDELPLFFEAAKAHWEECLQKTKKVQHCTTNDPMFFRKRLVVFENLSRAAALVECCEKQAALGTW